MATPQLEKGVLPSRPQMRFPKGSHEVGKSFYCRNLHNIKTLDKEHELAKGTEKGKEPPAKNKSSITEAERTLLQRTSSG